MSDITFEVSKTISVGCISKNYTSRRIFTANHYDMMIKNSDCDVDKLHNFINNELEQQLKRMIDKENT